VNVATKKPAGAGESFAVTMMPRGRKPQLNQRDFLTTRGTGVATNGMNQVKVEILKGALTIEGERKYEKEVAKKGYFTTERAYGTFFRRIPLPEEAKVGEAKAIFKNGIWR
jgi:hypothetical protein